MQIPKCEMLDHKGARVKSRTVPHVPTNLGSADELKETLEKEFYRLPTKFKDKYGCTEEDADSIIS
jgi:hypothetical protein